MTIKIELVLDTPERIAGADYACGLYNENNPKNQNAEDAEKAKPLTREEYVQFVLSRAADSWAAQADRAARMKEAGLV